ncbi:MAG: D-inositol-3-phosphate glycosyltransferase [Candidatus Celerinatantimonas neptuna]|nr:MAG: D-inositol-3-phosphate glycosyltransferase [Candidatus Celerinatantimonas neptuna]
MKVLHVNLARGFSGGESQTLQLITAQQRLGYQLAVVAHPKSPLTTRIRALDIPVYECSHFFQCHRRGFCQGYQLIHVHEGKAVYWAALQSWLDKIPYIITRRIDNPVKNKYLLKQAYRNASAVVGLSQIIADRIKERTDHPKIHIIPSSPVIYPVDKAQVDIIKSRFNSPFLVIQAGNLLHHKGFDVTINAAKRLASEAPDIQLILLGDGPLREELETQAQGLSNVTFAGKQPRESMGNWFAAAHLQIHPSYSEGLGSVILEGMQSGLTVVGTRAGGIVDIIDDGKNGFLIDPGNSDQLADAILTLYRDPTRREKMAQTAKQSMKRFAIEHTAQIYGDLYRQIALL